MVELVCRRVIICSHTLTLRCFSIAFTQIIPSQSTPPRYMVTYINETLINKMHINHLANAGEQQQK